MTLPGKGDENAESPQDRSCMAGTSGGPSIKRKFDIERVLQVWKASDQPILVRRRLFRLEFYSSSRALESFGQYRTGGSESHAPGQVPLFSISIVTIWAFDPKLRLGSVCFHSESRWA